LAHPNDEAPEEVSYHLAYRRPHALAGEVSTEARGWLWVMGLAVFGYATLKWLAKRKRRNAKPRPAPIVRWVVRWPVGTGGWPGIRRFEDQAEALEFMRATKGATMTREVMGGPKKRR
jgi:hypothetical protein